MPTNCPFRIHIFNFFLGTNLETGLVEIIEYNNHPWFVGVQFHPEYKSTVSKPHPLFLAFIKASLAKKGEV